MRQAEITCMNRWNTWLQKILSGDIIALCLTYINMNKYKVDNDLIVFSRCTQLYVTKKGCEIETTEVVALVRVRRCRFQQFHTCEWEQVAITAGNTRHHLLMKLARQQLLLWKWSTCPFEVHGNSRFLQASLKKLLYFYENEILQMLGFLWWWWWWGVHLYLKCTSFLPNFAVKWVTKLLCNITVTTIPFLLWTHCHCGSTLKN